MDINNMKYVYHVGYGLCKDDFTIEDISLAGFNYLDNAYNFVRSQQDDLSAYKKVYYIDGPIQGKQSKLQRIIYSRNDNSFFTAEEVLSGKRKIYVHGYDVTAYYEYEDDNSNIEIRTCLSYEKAQKEAKTMYLEDDASRVFIDAREDIDVNRYFWETETFFRGDDKQKNSNREAEDIYFKFYETASPIVAENEKYVVIHELMEEKWEFGKKYTLVLNSVLYRPDNGIFMFVNTENDTYLEYMKYAQVKRFMNEEEISKFEIISKMIKIIEAEKNSKKPNQTLKAHEYEDGCCTDENDNYRYYDNLDMEM